MGSTVLKDQDVEAQYEVTLRFRPGGLAVLGAWSKAETAEQVFMEWLGLYGKEGTVLTLNATAGSVVRPVKSWTYESGLQVAGADGCLPGPRGRTVHTSVRWCAWRR